MTRFPLAALVLLFIGAPALAQGTAYSFDNFDTRNGVRVYVEPPKPRVPSGQSRRPSKLETSKKTAASQNAEPMITLDDPARTLRPTVLVYDSLAASATNAGSPLRGYTTGSAQIDGYLIDSGSQKRNRSAAALFDHASGIEFQVACNLSQGRARVNAINAGYGSALRRDEYF